MECIRVEDSLTGRMWASVMVIKQFSVEILAVLFQYEIYIEHVLLINFTNKAPCLNFNINSAFSALQETDTELYFLTLKFSSQKWSKCNVMQLSSYLPT